MGTTLLCVGAVVANGFVTDDSASIVGEFERIDALALNETVDAVTKRRLARQAINAATCVTLPSADRGQCVVYAVMRHSDVRTGRNVRSVAGNTVTGALAGERGSCSAVTAIVLDVAESVPGANLEAVVFEDHVAVATKGNRDAVFELLRMGRLEPIGEREPVARVGLAGFPAYYADNLGSRLVQTGSPERGQVLFDYAVRANPAVARFVLNRAVARLASEDPVRALEDARRAVELSPTSRRAWEILVAAASRAGDEAELRRAKSRLVELRSGT